MDTIQWINSILNILGVLAIISGLWMAGRLLPIIISSIRSANLRTLLSRPLARLTLWLGLGALFTFPLRDFLKWLGYLTQVTLSSQEKFATALGTVPVQIYSAFNLLLMLAVYGVILWSSKSYLTTANQFNGTERFFVVLSIASLVFRIIQDTIIGVISFTLPLPNFHRDYGIIGFFFNLLIGLILLSIILIGLNRLSPNHPTDGKA